MRKMRWGEDPEFSGPRNYFRESLMIKEVKEYALGKKILDFGCGSGGLLLRLNFLDFYGKGVDVSKLAIKYLRDQIEKLKLSNKIEAQVGNENYLFSTRERFDIVVSGETLEHIKDDDKAIKGFYRVLKSEGICVVSVPAHMSLWDINDDFSSHFRRYSKESLEHKFADSGFIKLKSYYWGYPFSFFWHKFVYLPLIKKRLAGEQPYSKKSDIFGELLKINFSKKILSLPFYFDELFNWTNRGGGLIAVFQKA